MSAKKNAESALQLAYQQVRDATFCNTDISNAEKIALLEQVKWELLRSNQTRIDEE